MAGWFIFLFISIVSPFLLWDISGGPLCFLLTKITVSITATTIMTITRTARITPIITPTGNVLVAVASKEAKDIQDLKLKLGLRTSHLH